METLLNDQKVPIRMPSSLWEEVKSLSRRLTFERDTEISGHEITRRALRYALVHPEILEDSE
jgi:hypothetical protein